MRIHQLELVAYGPFPGTVSIDFDQLSAEGIFLLNGPTGSGKSSILDAISYALYGTTSSGRRDLKSRFAPADRVPRVTLECSIQGKRYRIERQPAYLRPKKKGSGLMQENAKCFIERFDPATESWGQDPLATRHKDAADFMLSLLGLNAQQFNQVILLPQGQFQRFLTASSQEREEVLKKLFATEEFQAIQTYLDQQAKEAKEAASQALRELEQLEALADGALAQAQIERAYRLLGWDLPERESEDESEEAHRSLDQLAPFYRLQAEDLARLSQALQARAQESREELKALKAEENRLAQLLETWKDYLKLSDQLEKLEAARPQQEQRQAALGSYRSAQRLLPLYQNAQRMQQEASSCQQKLSRGAEELEQLSLWAQEQLSSQALEAQAWASLKNKLGPNPLNLADQLDLADLGEQAAQLAQQLNQLKEEEAKLKDQLKEQQALAGQLARKEEALQALAVQAQKLGEQVAEKQEQLIDQAQLAISLHAAQEAHQKAQEAYQLAEKRAQAQQQQALASQRAQQAEGLRLEANAHYNHLQALRFSGALQGLVASLEEGKPCPVCGSPSHPNPAPLEGPQQEVSDRSLKEAQQKRDRAEEQARSSLQELARVKATLDQLLEAGALDLAEAKDLQQQAAGELRQQEAISRTQAQLLKTLQKLERELATLEEKQQEEASQLAIIQDRKDQLEGQMSQLEARLSSQQEGPDFRARAQQLQILTRQVADYKALSQEYEGLKKLAQDLDADYLQALAESDFADQDQLLAAQLPAKKAQQLEADIEAYQQQVTSCQARLSSPALLEIAQKQDQASPQAAEEELLTLQGQIRSLDEGRDLLLSQQTRISQALDQLQQALERLEEKQGSYQLLEEQAQLAKDLAATANASPSADNRLKMTLTTYVLAHQLNQVTLAASQHLQGMTHGRYRLQYSDERQERGKSGLGILIYDAWHNANRQPSSLSGGETFMASLALALGLAEVVQGQKGGIDIDTLFVDEGFGSLDQQTLEEVMATLDSLREGGRVVGLISHVADLKNRISRQLLLDTGPQGSYLKEVEEG